MIQQETNTTVAEERATLYNVDQSASDVDWTPDGGDMFPWADEVPYAYPAATSTVEQPISDWPDVWWGECSNDTELWADPAPPYSYPGAPTRSLIASADDRPSSPPDQLTDEELDYIASWGGRETVVRDSEGR